MAPCKKCGQRRARKTISQAEIRYVLKNQQGEVIGEYGNRSQAALAFRDNPSATLHKVKGGGENN